MSETFKPEINELIKKPDNFEKLIKHIALILKGEAVNQYALAKIEKAYDAEDYNLKIFIQNARPYDTGGEAIKTPFVNIMLQKTETMDGNARAGQQKTKAIFIIDCIAFGNDSGETWNEKTAAARAWKTARIIRRILTSDAYTYLGLRGVVGSRNILSIETGVPENGGDALTVVAVRITLEVQFIEGAINSPESILEEIHFEITLNGELIIN
jgi:hypothetical protein